MVQLLTSLPTSMGLRFKKQNHSLLFDNAFMCSLDEGREDQVNLNCSENEQQWRRVDRERGKHGGHREDRGTRGMQGRGRGKVGGGQGRERGKEGGGQGRERGKVGGGQGRERGKEGGGQGRERGKKSKEGGGRKE